jgi:hypothetical protein
MFVKAGIVTKKVSNITWIYLACFKYLKILDNLRALMKLPAAPKSILKLNDIAVETIWPTTTEKSNKFS